MSPLSTPQVYAIVAQALDYLDAKGRRLAVDELLRLFTFLGHLQAGHIDRQYLARYITPLLANTPEEQLGISQCILNAVLLYKEDDEHDADPPVEGSGLEGPLEKSPEAADKGKITDTNPNPPKTPQTGTSNPLRSRATGTYVAEVQKFDKPPYIWQVDLGAEHLMAEPRNIRVLVNQLQERQLLDAHELDIERTVKGMSTNPGVFRPRYRQLTQAPSYLLLIDERARNDHRARIFDMLYGYLRFNDIEVQRFFFDADPRTCFNENHPYGISLATLYEYHRSARLLLLSYGYELFSPSTGEWTPWTRTFLQWQERVLLSPMPIQNWGGWENKLSQRFTVLPATPLGLSASIKQFGQEEALHWDTYLDDIADAVREPVYFQGSLMGTLEHYYGDEAMRLWIAACAFYPALHWQLTLHLGVLLQNYLNRADLVTLEKLLELTRLPWFIEGRIPDAARGELLEWLQNIGKEQPLRALLLQSLNKAPAPPDGSAAYAEYRMQIVFNQWMLETDLELKAKLEEEFARYLEAGNTPDFVSFKRLERKAKQSDFVIPEAWRRFFAEEENKEIGGSPNQVGSTANETRNILFFNNGKWIVNLGSLHGVSLSASVLAVFAVYKKGEPMPFESVKAIKVGFQYTEVGFDGNTAEEYDAKLIRLSEPGILVTADIPFIQQLEAFQKKDPSVKPVFASITTDAGGAYRLEYIPGQILIKRPDGELVKGLAMDNGDKEELLFRNALYDLDHIAKWHRFTSIEKHSELLQSDYFNPELRYINQNGYEVCSMGSCTVEMYKNDDGGQRVKFRLFLKNPSSYDLYCSIFYLPNNFAISNLIIQGKIAAGTEVELYSGDFVLNTTLKEETFYLKVIISSQVMEDDQLGQEALHGVGKLNRNYPNRGREKSQTRRAIAGDLDEGDWFTKTIAVHLIEEKQDMVLVPGGTFQMGDVMRDNEKEHETVHTVTLSDFLIGKNEVTFEEYDAFCTATKREKPSDSGWGRGKRPVINVSWGDVVAYCNWRSKQEGLEEVYTINGSSISANWQANGYRLPTEAEWEYAARAGGKNVRFGNGKDIANPREINFDASARKKKPYSIVGEYRSKTLPVGSFSPNTLGLYDMSGNVWEWCWDWYGSYPYYVQTNPKGPDKGSERIIRGGAWFAVPQSCRIAYRYNGSPDSRSFSLGFRLSKTLTRESSL